MLIVGSFKCNGDIMWCKASRATWVWKHFCPWNTRDVSAPSSI